jgi:tetratricopeptide (TPR) repeat protein
MRTLPALAAVAAILWLPGRAAFAQAQLEVPDSAGSELGQIRLDFEYGKFKEVLQRARNLLDRGGLSDDQLAELHRLAGVAAFNQGLTADAERHLSTLLRIDPDASLDPFLFPPPAVQYLEKLRKQLASDLNVIRQERRIQVDRRHRAEEDRERAKQQAAELQRKLDDLTRRVTVRTVEKRVFMVNFVPFGAGQFQQGRNSMGLLLATTEGGLGATSVVAYFAYSALFRDFKIHIPNVLNPNGTGYLDVTYRAIPTDRRLEASVWRIAQFGAGIGFYFVYLLGVIDALLNHEDQVVTTSMEERPPEAASPETPAPGLGPDQPLEPPPPPATRRDGLRPLPSTALALRLWAGIQPLPGGLGASLRLDF